MSPIGHTRARLCRVADLCLTSTYSEPALIYFLNFQKFLAKFALCLILCSQTEIGAFMAQLTDKLKEKGGINALLKNTYFRGMLGA